jgi:hypothetical protein
MFNMTPTELRLLADAAASHVPKLFGHAGFKLRSTMAKAKAQADKLDQLEKLRSNVPAVTEALTAAAEAFPEQRTGQILSNALGYSDPFHVEDDRLCELIYKYIEEYKND